VPIECPREHPAIDEDVVDRAGAAERAAGIDGHEAVDDAVDRERAAGRRSSPAREVLVTVQLEPDLVEGREAVRTRWLADQAEVEGVLAGAAELKRVGAVAEHEAAWRRCPGPSVSKAIATAAESDRRETAGVDGARIEDSAGVADGNAHRPCADIDRAGVDDGIAASETGNASMPTAKPFPTVMVPPVGDGVESPSTTMPTASSPRRMRPLLLIVPTSRYRRRRRLKVTAMMVPNA
jgi:hypothetical protein